MPQNLTSEDLQAVGDPIAAGLLPAWKVSWVLLSQEDLDSLDPNLPGPNLAIVKSIPERRIATAHIVNPFPDGESLSQTLNHELGHVWISPITSQLDASGSAVMLEEQLIETLGNYLDSLTGAARAAARRALAGVVERYAPQLRARISARAPLARSGGPMDPKMVTEALEALIGGDDEKCAEILKGMIAQAAGGAAPAVEPDGDEAAEMAAGGDQPMAEKPKPAADAAPAPVGAPKPAESARVAARIAQVDEQHTRARKAADAAVSVTVRARLRELRSEGVSLSTAKEAELSKMTDLDRFEERVADILEGRKLAAPGGARARTAAPTSHGATPPPAEEGTAPVSAEQLKAEGADESFIQMYTTIATSDPSGAAGLLAGFREPTAVAARARLAGKGPTARALHAVRS